MPEQNNDSKTHQSIVEEVTPYHEEVNSVSLEQEIRSIINRYIVLPKGADYALTLWILGTYAFDDFHIFPKLVFHSPEKRCGKSTALDIVEAISNKTLFSSNITPAALFRVIDKYHPTLVIDEADTFVSGRNDELIGIINSGHARNRAHVIRTVGDNHEPKQFSTWSPQAFASIRRLQGTIMDRAIVIALRRKTIDEKTARIPATLKPDLYLLRQKITRWYKDNSDQIINSQLEPHNLGNDRAVDNWLPLFTIANAISPECLTHCKIAYHLLNMHEDETSIQTQLLADIKEIFTDTGIERIPSDMLVEKLVAMEEKPWSEWKHGQPMTVNTLANLLTDFNIKSKQFRFGQDRHRGYELKSLKDVFRRYLPVADSEFNRDNVTKSSNKAISVFQTVTSPERVTDTNQPEPALENDCHVVTVGTGQLKTGGI